MFWLGVHHPSWLETLRVPLMVSYRRLRGRRRLPRAAERWFEDSGGFTELDKYSSYQTTPREYARAVELHRVEVGNLAHASIQDWMCEPHMLARTGLDVTEHQRRTIASYFDLIELAPDVPWLPVLQGWETRDYLNHVDQWLRAGVDLTRAALVGIGTVCTRQNTVEAVHMLREIVSRTAIRLHAFGFKSQGITRGRYWLASADSMAWSFDGRQPQGGRCSRTRTHKSCANCPEYAVRWRARLMNVLSQQSLFPIGGW